MGDVHLYIARCEHNRGTDNTAQTAAFAAVVVDPQGHARALTQRINPMGPDTAREEFVALEEVLRDVLATECMQQRIDGITVHLSRNQLKDAVADLPVRLKKVCKDADLHITGVLEKRPPHPHEGTEAERWMYKAYCLARAASLQERLDKQGFLFIFEGRKTLIGQEAQRYVDSLQPDLHPEASRDDAPVTCVTVRDAVHASVAGAKLV